MMKAIARGTMLDGKIDCYVVDDDGIHRRMIGAGGILAGIGAADGGGLHRYLNRLPSRYAILANRPATEVSLPGGGLAKCYDAEHFADVLAAYSELFINGELHYSQIEMGKAAYRTSLGYQKLGLIAHIDEATGYQLQRAKGELEDTLARLISFTPCEWDLMWDPETVKSICDLYGWNYDGKRIPHQFRAIVMMCYRKMMGDDVTNKVHEVSLDSDMDSLIHQHIKPEYRPGLRNMVQSAGRLAEQSATPEEWRRRLGAFFGTSVKTPTRQIKKTSTLQSVMDFFKIKKPVKS